MRAQRPPLWLYAALFGFLMAAGALHGAPNNNTAAISAAHDYVSAAMRASGVAAQVSVDSPAPGVQLPPCARYEFFLPVDSRLWGKSRLGVKCSTPSAWTAYLQVNVAVSGSYLVSAKKINRGQAITDSDVEQRVGDLTTLPESTLTEPEQATDQRAKVSLAAGQVLRREHLVRKPVIKQGDSVRILIKSASFSVATEGTALQDAAVGDTIKLRNSTGKTLSGIVRAQGEVEILP